MYVAKVVNICDKKPVFVYLIVRGFQMFIVAKKVAQHLMSSTFQIPDGMIILSKERKVIFKMEFQNKEAVN